jgi:hypothetical protein
MTITATPEGVSADRALALGEVFLTEDDLARRHKMSKGAVQARRHRGEGPPAIKLSNRVYRFKLSAVVAWENEREAAQPTAEEQAKAELRRADFVRRVRPLGMKRKAQIAAKRRRERVSKESKP